MTSPAQFLTNIRTLANEPDPRKRLALFSGLTYLCLDSLGYRQGLEEGARLCGIEMKDLGK